MILLETAKNLIGNALNVLVLTNTSIDTFTTGEHTRKILVEMVGGGGGGGGAANSSSGQISAGTSGGAGGYAMKLFTVTPSTLYAYQCGSAGTGGSNTGGSGNNGGNSILTVGGVSVIAYGGTGGGSTASGTAARNDLGGAGGVISTDGDVNAGGMAGGMYIRQSGTVAIVGAGGTSQFGAGGAGRTSNGAGNAGVGYGAGGGGAMSVNAGGGQTGGNGTQGVIIVYELG